ncbi:hypothetical protein HDV02_003738 [Globomyces sp. JEL0801]|nr:hypothetical protein HDV02_003738 [Globomyces sp. JEL0801]
MFSRAIGRRCYSTAKPEKLWVKHNGNLSTQVSTKSCINIDDFADKVKQKLNTNCQVALFTSLDKEPIKPWLTIKELIKTEFKNNSGESPLLVKIIPASQDQITPKTIYNGETDEDGEFMGEYKRRILRNDHDLMKVIKPEAQGLIHPSSPDDVLLSFDDIKDGEKYQLYKFAQNFQSWQKKRS